MKICTKNDYVKAYKCELCPFESAFKYKVKSCHDSFHVNMKEEIKESKKKNKEHPCPICRRSFKSNKLLKQHSRSHEVKSVLYPASSPRSPESSPGWNQAKRFKKKQLEPIQSY